MPSLTPTSPERGQPIALIGAETVIGATADSDIRVDIGGIGSRHAVVQQRDGAWWLLPGHAWLRLNDQPVVESMRLRDRDVITIAADHQYEFATGEARTRRMESLGSMVARPRKRHYRQLPKPPRRFSLGALGTVLVAVALLGGAAFVTWYGLMRTGPGPGVLTDRQAAELDSLLIAADDHVERGGTLLELGLGDGAADEFAKAVNTLALSDLRDHPQVKPRIVALQASVAAIYRERSLAVPENYANATAPLTAEQLKTASLTVPQFAAQFAIMAATFRDKFGHDIIVTGRDHAEHVALYGKGGAMDLSAKAMNATEIGFVVNQCHARHIRIKDFSQDSVLRREISAAVHAGLLFEAGTGLHLHIDRFANRRDRWTTTLLSPSPERGDQPLDGRAPTRILVERGGKNGGQSVTTADGIRHHRGPVDIVGERAVRPGIGA
jgi:hypothetical protein